MSWQDTYRILFDFIILISNDIIITLTFLQVAESATHKLILTVLISYQIP